MRRSNCAGLHFLRCTKLIIAATGNEWDCVCLLWSVADDGESRRGAVRSRGTRINIIIVWPETMPPSAALLLIIITFALHLTLTQVSSKHFAPRFYIFGKISGIILTMLFQFQPKEWSLQDVVKLNGNAESRAQPRTFGQHQLHSITDFRHVRIYLWLIKNSRICQK
jgi:hypothetical protein